MVTHIVKNKEFRELVYLFRETKEKKTKLTQKSHRFIQHIHEFAQHLLGQMQSIIDTMIIK